ncbi:MAG: hypothetical protein IPL52_00965 [Flavobacteriales bacterium]|nr:hypothetical protein [Flavobacteriales bacterium]
MKKKHRHRKRLAVIIGAVLVLLAAGAWLGDRTLKAKGHPGLRTFLGQWARNYPASLAVEPELLSITVDERDLERLERTVEEARERGVIMPEGNEYVDAEIGSGADRFKAKLRIKGKLTDHVQGSKWSFRIVAKKDGGWRGMKRFSLQHPGTRNYLCDWVYHRLMANEGVIALRYGFLRVSFNEEDLGIYAYEEHFGPELLEQNGRLPGPLFRFDPALFWEHRLNEMNKLRFDEPYAAYQAAAVDAFGSSDLVKDDKLRGQFEEAVTLLDGFRRGEMTASQVFDAGLTARHHAILDLIGGHHSMDWSDVKFYYDPAAKRIEPVAYESFSAFPLKTLAGSYRWVGHHEAAQDLHDQYFNDEQVFRAYVKHLERVSRKSWLDSTFAAMKPALDSASATLYREFPYKELDRGIYYRNQKVIRKLLNGPKPFHAYLGDLAKDTVRITIVPIEGLPMEVHALLLPDGTRAVPVGNAIVPCRRPGKLGEPFEIRFAVNGEVKRDGLKLGCSVLGASTQREVEVFPHTFSVSADQDRLLRDRTPNAKEFDFLVVDELAKTITIKPGAWKLDRTMVLPSGYRCMAVSPLKLDIVAGAEMISYSRLQWSGSPDMPIIIHSSDSSSHGVHVIDAEGRSQLHRVVFSDLTRYKYDQERSGDVSFHRSAVSFKQCVFAGTGATLLDVSVCAVDLDACRFDHGSDQFESHFAQVTMNDATFELAHDDAISIEGGSAALNKVFIGGGKGIGVKGTKGAHVTATDLHIDRMGKGLEGRQGARMQVSTMDAQEVPVIADAQKREMRYGPVAIELKGLKADATDASYEVGEGSSITLDGKRVGFQKAKEGT